jgi:hypothetical protein
MHRYLTEELFRALGSPAGLEWFCGVVLYTGSEVIPFAANLHGLPLSQLWATHPQ